MKKCYFCGENAKSKEHVPARCFFPEDDSYRKQLITVPSCEKHNEDTSVDDEYVRNIICSFHLNNATSFRQFLNKVVKSLTLNKSQDIKLKKVRTEQGEVPGIIIDRERLDRVIRKISYALFYNDYKIVWKKELEILSRHLVFDDLSSDNYSSLIDYAEQSLPAITQQGENPEVFKYTFLNDGQDIQNSILRVVFYEGFTFWIIAKENSTENKMQNC